MIEQVRQILFTEKASSCSFCTYFIYFVALVGLLQVLSIACSILSFLNRHFLRTRHNLYKRYGDKDTWAVVTGGSDGIGLEFCRQLAKEGFNICIVARNEEKMKQKLEEIKSLTNNTVKTMYVVADLSKLTKISDYVPIADKLKNIDIGMLLLNAGASNIGPLVDLRPDEIQDTITINALHPIYLCKVLLNQIIERKQKSAIIITSSGLGHFAAPAHIPYSAGKAFSSYLGQGLNYELKGKVDVLSFECGEVSTKLLRRKPSLTILVEKPVVNACLRDLGRESLTYGAARHEMLMQPLKSSFMLKFIQKMIYKGTIRVFKLKREKEAKEQKIE